MFSSFNVRNLSEYSFFLFIFVLQLNLCADVKSTNGTILFDTENDTNTEMILNSNGLGIGVSPTQKLEVNGNALIMKELIIGSNAPTGSNLNLGGTIGFDFEIVSSNITLNSSSYYFINSTVSDLILTLPDISNRDGQMVTVKKTNHSGNVYIVAANLIDGSEQVNLSTNYAFTTFLAGQDSWYILDKDTDTLSSELAQDNLILLLQLEETTSGVVEDSSSIGNDGAHNNFAAGNIGVTGAIGYSVFFDGVDDSIQVPSNANYDSNEFTISCWIKSDGNWGTDGGSVPNDASIISRLDAGGSTNGCVLLHLTPGTVYFYAKNGVAAVLDVVGVSNVADEQWHHILVRGSRTSGEVVEMYIDGVFEANGTNTATWTFNSQDLIIGDSDDTFWEEWSGFIDDVRWYNRQLSNSEVEVLKILGPN